jgi:hypothetical protein
MAWPLAVCHESEAIPDRLGTSEVATYCGGRQKLATTAARQQAKKKGVGATVSGSPMLRTTGLALARPRCARIKNRFYGI